MAVAPELGPKTWIIVGASRGIGLEFVRQLLDQDKQVIAVVRNPDTIANQLWQVVAGQARPMSCIIEQCDVRSESQIEAFVGRMKLLTDMGMNVEGVVMNAGILSYPNRALETSYVNLSEHLQTNAIGPVTIAQRLMNNHKYYSTRDPSDVNSCPLPPNKLIFISSDSGSMVQFRDFEDGFAAYAASKVALNMLARHMSVELKRRGGVWEEITVLCLHPGEVSTDMGAIEVDWEVSGIISAQESVEGMLKVIDSKGKENSGSFWCWDGREHPW